MDIFMYSDQIIEENRFIDNKLIEVAIEKVGQIDKVVLGYIPSNGDKERTYYNNRVKYYSNYGIQNFMFFDLADEYNEELINNLSKCTIIHLSGGMPIQLNQNVKKRGFGKFLKEYINGGGIIVGVSAGAIQLTQSIGLHLAYKFGYDYEDINHMESLTTSKLVDFEFLPHVNRFDQNYIDGLQIYADKYSVDIYCCKDGSGLYINNDGIERIGEVYSISSKV